MQWKPDGAVRVLAITPYARLVTRRITSWQYAAWVYSAAGAQLAHNADLPTGEAAQRWAERAYAELLRAELGRLAG